MTFVSRVTPPITIANCDFKVPRRHEYYILSWRAAPCCCMSSDRSHPACPPHLRPPTRNRSRGHAAARPGPMPTTTGGRLHGAGMPPTTRNPCWFMTANRKAPLRPGLEPISTRLKQCQDWPSHLNEGGQEPSGCSPRRDREPDTPVWRRASACTPLAGPATVAGGARTVVGAGCLSANEIRNPVQKEGQIPTCPARILKPGRRRTCMALNSTWLQCVAWPKNTRITSVARIHTGCCTTCTVNDAPITSAAVTRYCVSKLPLKSRTLLQSLCSHRGVGHVLPWGLDRSFLEREDRTATKGASGPSTQGKRKVARGG